MGVNDKIQGVLEKRRKIVKKEKDLPINIGTVIFGLIFIYIIVSGYMYLTARHVSSYMVTTGTLSNNFTYTAIAIRNEEVIHSPSSGYVNYRIQSGGKASKNDIVCGISDSRPATSARDMTEEDFTQVRELASKFTKAFDTDSFDEVYNLKYALSTQAEVKITDGNIPGNPVTADTDGIISYVTDGMEKLKASEIKPDDFSFSVYKSRVMKANGHVEAGSPVFKIIRDDEWQLVFPLSDQSADSLANETHTKIKFAQDGNVENGDLKIIKKGKQNYAQVTLYSGVVRYCDDRLLRIELVTNEDVELKIPISAIVNKRFYKIPKDFLDEKENGFSRLVKDDGDGKSTVEFVKTDLYELSTGEKDTDGRQYYCVDQEDFKKGDILVKENSKKTFVVGLQTSMPGVYCINRGYAQFRKIEEITENKSYALVKSGTPYGISKYDYIVRDGSCVNESDILRMQAP
jgi:hypothetical protein